MEGKREEILIQLKKKMKRREKNEPSLIIRNNTVVVSKMGVFASYACLLNPLIT